MGFSNVLAFIVFTAAVGIVNCEYDEVYKAIKDKCRKSVSITDEEFKTLMRKDAPTTKAEKCYFACIYKGVGVLDAAGKFSKKGIHAFAEKKYKGHKEKLESLMNIVEPCYKVNDMDVVDGIKGCERVGLHFECIQKENDVGALSM